VADTQVLEQDVSYESRQPAGAVEEQQDLRVPDDRASWAIGLIYEWENGKGKELRERAKKMFKYYNGDQWDPTVRSKMESSDDPRPVMTFNEIRPKIDILSGEERRNREDWVAKPREGSDEEEAQIRTALLKYKRDQNTLAVEESRAFEEGIIGGYAGVACDLVADPEGGAPLIHVEARDWSEFRWDLTSRKPDMTDAHWMALSVMASPDRLSELFPNWSVEINGEYASLCHDPLIEEADIGERIGVTRYLDGRMRKTLFDTKEKKIRTIQFYYRTMRKREYLTIQGPQGLVEREVPEGDNKELRALADQLLLTGRAQRKIVAEKAIRGLLIVGRRTLAQWWSPFDGQDAFGTPYFPLHLWKASDTDGYIMGLVESLVSPQDEVNKRWTMMVENYLKTARSGGLYEENAFENEAEAKRKWGSPGYWAKVRQNAISQQRIKEHTAKPPDTALMMLFQAAEASVDRISNMDKGRMGMLSREESGVAIRTRAVQSALVQVKAFDNFRNFQLRLGRFLNANLHLEFPVRRTIRLVMPTGDTKSVVLNEVVRTQTGATRIANNTRSAGLYDIIMDLTPGNATFREMQAQNLGNLIGQIGPPMKELPWFLPAYAALLKGQIKMIDGLPNRDEIIKALDAATQAVAQGGPGAPGQPPPPPEPKVSIALKGDLSPETAADLADGRLDSQPIPAQPEPPTGASTTVRPSVPRAVPRPAPPGPPGGLPFTPAALTVPRAGPVGTPNIMGGP